MAHWTTTEVTLLEKLYPVASWDDLNARGLTGGPETTLTLRCFANAKVSTWFRFC